MPKRCTLAVTLFAALVACGITSSGGWPDRDAPSFESPGNAAVFWEAVDEKPNREGETSRVAVAPCDRPVRLGSRDAAGTISTAGPAEGRGGRPVPFHLRL